MPAAIKRLPWFAETDLSDEQDRAMNAARATAVYRQILRQLNRKAYAAKRPTVREQAQSGLLVGVGVKGLAKACQCNVRTVRKRLEWLEANGYIQRLSNMVEIVTRDPLTGQIKTNVIGRRKAISIQLTVQACHCRPRKKPKGFDRGTQNPDTGHWVNHDRGTGAPPDKPVPVRYRGTGAPTFPSNSSIPIVERQPPASGESGSGSRSTKPDEQSEKAQREAARSRRRYFRADAHQNLSDSEYAEWRRAAAAAQAADRAKREATPTSRPDSLEATPMNPATVRAADAATAAGKPPQTIRESKPADRQRTAVQQRPTPPQPRQKPWQRKQSDDQEYADEQAKKRAIIEQIAAAERSAAGVSMTRAKIAERSVA